MEGLPAGQAYHVSSTGSICKVCLGPLCIMPDDVPDANMACSPTNPKQVVPCHHMSHVTL
jgi:hypothetical protein